MRTWAMDFIPAKNKTEAAVCQYFKTNTTDFKCMYNTANFYIRNTMTGLKKSPEERTHLETEVLHYVFTGIQKANEDIGPKQMARILRDCRSAKAGGMQCAVRAYKLTLQEPFRYPTREKWFLSYGVLDAIFKFTDNPVYKRMNSQVNQNAIRKVVSAWTGYFELQKKYREDSLHNDKPKIPGYLKNTESTAWFSSQTAKLQEEDGKYWLRFVNLKERVCIGSTSLYEGMKYVKTEIKPVYGYYRILVTFDDKVKEKEPPESPKRILGLDPGMGNFLAVANNFGGVPFVIRGGAIKSANQRFNKKRAALISSLTKGKDSTKSVKYSEQLNILSRKRENFLRDYFYKCAWYVCRYAQVAGVEVTVMGHNKGQKHGISLLDSTNQNFVSIPYTKFIIALTSVAAECGIAVVLTEESYTSQASLLDMDEIPVYSKGNTGGYTFSGRRVKRGLYRSEDGILINADINGAGNIIRKEYPDAFAGLNDLSYLYTTTMSVGYKDLYKEAKAPKKRSCRFHKEGRSSRVRYRERKELRTFYRELWGDTKYIWKPEEKTGQEGSEDKAA